MCFKSAEACGNCGIDLCAGGCLLGLGKQNYHQAPAQQIAPVQSAPVRVEPQYVQYQPVVQPTYEQVQYVVPQNYVSNNVGYVVSTLKLFTK